MNDSQLADRPPASVVGDHRLFRGTALCALLSVLLLLPFVNKAFHIDDALFLRLAEQIRSQPLAPYEFHYNWDHEPEPFWRVTQNPPLAGYVLAAAELLVGMQEWKLRLIYIPLAAIAVVLTYLVAKRFCASPQVVALLSLIAPAFLVTATNVQADVLLLVLWLLAVWLTVWAVDSGQSALWWPVGLMVAAAAMTKYFGIALVPLLLAYLILKAVPKRSRAENRRDTADAARRIPIHVIALALPIAALVGWSIYSKQQSGAYHPLGAAAYSLQLKDAAHVSLVTNVAHVLAFFGGTMLWPIFLIPVGIRLPKWVCGALVALAAYLVWREAPLLHDPANYLTWTWADSAMYAVMALSGAMVLAIAASSIVARPDADSTFLGLWLFGTFVFCAFFNWTVSARIVLPCVLPALLLTVRWIETFDSRRYWMRWLGWSALPAAAISLLVGFSDQDFANAARTFAQTNIRERRERRETVYFTGHWGFQHYMEREGALAFNYRRQVLLPGDVVVFPYNNTANDPLEVQLAEFNDKVRLLPDVEICEFPRRFPFHTMSTKAHSWFYASLREPLPFNCQKQRFVDQFSVARFSPELKGLAGMSMSLEHPHLFQHKPAAPQR